VNYYIFLAFRREFRFSFDPSAIEGIDVNQDLAAISRDLLPKVLTTETWQLIRAR